MPPSSSDLEKAWASVIHRQIQGVLDGDIRQPHQIPALYAALHYLWPIASMEEPWAVVQWQEEHGRGFGPIV